MEFAPDGRLFVAQQGGKLRVVKNGSLLAEPFVTLPVDSNGDRGLIGVAFDPNFAVNQYVYVYYTATTPTIHNRVSRFTANGDVAVPGSERILFEIDPLGTATIHNGGDLQFRPDGKLYITTGENATPTNAQSLSTTLGKVLRINPDGSIPTDNPFYNSTDGNNRAIWALGLRNPFTAAVQPGTGRYFINDVGAKSWEEIDNGFAGANYGWPLTEGTTTDPRFTSPVFTYSHGPPLISPTNGCAIAGGDFYNPAVTTFPSEYVGDYFFADNCSGWIRKVDPADGFAVSDFATGIAGPVDVEVGADGSLYYLSRPETGSGSVYRVSYSLAPAISQQPSDTTVAPGQAATFAVSATGQGPLAYQWQRDGVAIAGATSSTYTLADSNLADDGAQFRCVVTNAGGSATSASATLTVTSNGAPTGTIVSPDEGTTFNAGQTISYAGTGTDAEDGQLPASAFTWEVVFHHNTHTHSFIPAFSGVKSGTFDIPDTGETADDIFYRIRLTVTDSGGRQHSSYRDVRPNKSSMTVATSPAGLQVTVEAEPKASPYSTLSVVGMKRTLGVVSPQTVNGVTYEFSSWSDGGAATHEITTPSADTTYTATFRPVADTVKPAVAVTVPAAGATVRGNVNLAANASDASGLTKVEWWVDGVRVATDTDGAPWAKAWNSASVADGTHKILAKARDTAGNWGASLSVTFSVSQTPPPPDTTAPTATVTVPAAGATVSGTAATLSANATDNVAVTSVRWFVDGVEVAADTNGSPWTATWNSTTVADGAHAVVAKAADAAGNLGTSAGVSFTVSNSISDTVKPAVAVTVPVAGATVSGNVDLAANASDASGLTKVEWWVDGVRVATDTDGAPWTKAWNSASVADGTHKILAKARDTAGNWGTSRSVTFSVSPTTPPPDTTAPTVTVTAPAADATVSGTAATLSANATDNVAVTSVRWFVDGVQVAADTNGAPWTATWNSTTVADGAHAVLAKAADAAGNLGTSAGVSFTVSNAPVGGTLFGDGFESGGFSAWSTVRTGADGTATVQTPAAKTGTYGAQLSATANTGSYAYARKTIATQTELTVSGDFKVTQEGVSGGDVVFFRLLDPTGARVASLKRQNLDRDKLRVSIGSTGFDTTDRLALDTWAQLELHVVVAGTGVSTVEVRLNGTTVYRNTTASLGYEGIATVQIGNDTAKQTFTLHADNIEARR